MMTLTHGTLPTIGEITKQIMGKARGGTRQRGGLHVTKQRLWGGSKEAGGDHEAAFFGRLDDATRQACRRAVDQAFERGRALFAELRKCPRELALFERHCMGITITTIRVYQALLRMEKLFKGRLFPTYEKIAEWATCSRSTVARALKALDAIGLLDRLRRYDCTKSEKIGARSTQTSSAYRLGLTKPLQELIAAKFRPAPLPDDEAQRHHERLADHAAMLSGLSTADYIRATTTDQALADILVRWGEGIEKRDRLAS